MDRWAARRAMRSRCRCGSSILRSTPPSNACSGARNASCAWSDRAGHAFDPDIAACLLDHAGEILTWDEHASVWDEALSCEPSPPPVLEGETLDRALAAMGNFADLISPYVTGHSAAVAELAAAAGRSSQLDDAGVTELRRAALLHDLGRVAVHSRTWQKPGPLNADEWEQVRLHPYYTERVLTRSEFLAALAPIAGAHHERLDGSGYHRGSAGAALGCLPACWPRPTPIAR